MKTSTLFLKAKHFYFLLRMAEEFGMKLIYRKPFDKYFAEKFEISDHRSLLGRMQALEVFTSITYTILNLKLFLRKLLSFP